ncbi:hypothetical protein JCM10207_007410 [Rhodosporidiobolus poonsookiae]
MALAYLGSWLPSFSGGAAIDGPQQPQLKHAVSEAELNKLHQDWVRLQASHQTEAERLLARLVAENDELKIKLAETDRELRDVKAGRKEDEELLKKATKEIERLGGKRALAVAILDFEADLFAPEIFHHADAGRHAVDALHRKLRRSLLSLPEAERNKTWQFLCIVSWTRRGEFVKKLIAHGLISSVAELDDFINGFNRAHPLFMFVVSNTPPELSLQRQRALAATFGFNPVCQRLILGRWALDLPLAEMICPSRGAEKVTFDKKILFVEPFDGFYLLPQLKKREPQIVVMEGVLRRWPLKEGGGFGSSHGKREVDYSRPLWQQTPPICLDYYLSPTRCTDERCTFSHSYQIPRDVLSALRYDLSRTPCPLVLSGHSCPDGEACHFAHFCPRKEMCPRRGCAFTAPNMHPRYVPPAPPPAPVFRPQQATQAPASPDRSARGGFKHGSSALPGSAKPPSTRSALERLLSSSSQQPKSASPPAQPFPSTSFGPAPHPFSPSRARQPGGLVPVSAAPSSSSKKHAVPLGSPFGHPLSLADAAEAVAHGVTDPTLDGIGASMVDLTDEELAALLEKARKEEEEYEKGLAEDPFVDESGAAPGAGRGGLRESSLFGAGGGGPQTPKMTVQVEQDPDAARRQQAGADYAEWKDNLWQNTDDFVASLLQDQLDLADQIEQIPSVPPPRPVMKRKAIVRLSSSERIAHEKRVEQLDAQAREIEEELAKWKTTNGQLKAKEAQEIDELSLKEEQVRRAESTAPPRAPKPVTLGTQPHIVVLIDASSAPFGEAMIQQGFGGGQDAGHRLRWEIEKDSREHDIALEDGESDQTGVGIVGIIFQHKAALVENLQKNGVIKQAKTWDDFLVGFTEVGINHVMDVGTLGAQDPMASLNHMASVIRNVGRLPAVKQLYLAGVGVDNLREACPELKPSQSAFYTDVGRKIVLINAREQDDDRELLAASGWRVTVFRRYFSSQYGLGYDLGWRFRPMTPPVGPGDQNHEDGDDENGFAQVIDKGGFKHNKNEDGGWVRANKGKHKVGR